MPYIEQFYILDFGVDREQGMVVTSPYSLVFLFPYLIATNYATLTESV